MGLQVGGAAQRRRQRIGERLEWQAPVFWEHPAVTTDKSEKGMAVLTFWPAKAILALMAPMVCTGQRLRQPRTILANAAAFRVASILRPVCQLRQFRQTGPRPQRATVFFSKSGCEGLWNRPADRFASMLLCRWTSAPSFTLTSPEVSCRPARRHSGTLILLLRTSLGYIDSREILK